jgi:hypothetical protein
VLLLLKHFNIKTISPLVKVGLIVNSDDRGRYACKRDGICRRIGLERIISITNGPDGISYVFLYTVVPLERLRSHLMDLPEQRYESVGRLTVIQVMTSNMLMLKRAFSLIF